MKKIIILGIISIILVALFFAVTFLVKGTPWGKAEALKTAQDYLSMTYTQKMIANHVSYDIVENQYLITAYPTNNEALKFLLYIDKKGNVWKDQYYLRYFSYELGKEANEYTIELYGEGSRAYASLDGEIIDIYNISNLNENTKLEEVIDKFDRKYYFGLVLSGEFSNSEDDVVKLYKFINFTNSLRYKPYKISISYYDDGKDTPNFRLRLKEKEYQSIASTKDLFQYLDKVINGQ